ncbi:MAG: LacI family DNA-binding transcriptional regulator [Pseudonocardia sediminis]
MVRRARSGQVGVVDLARELGVSTATVSRALNDSDAVRPELAERIRSHARDRGYVPNRLARALSASVSRAFVGFVVPYVDTPAYSAVAAECARLLSAGGTQMILTITENDPERELRQLRELTASRVAGLVISPSTHMLPESRELLASIPVVELHRASGITAPGVFSDDERVLDEAVGHLAGLGHRAIAYLGTPEALSNGAARLQGVRHAMGAAGLDPDAMAVHLAEPTPENGRRGVDALLDAGSDPTALLVVGGALSIGAAQRVRERGLRLPDDLSLVVYGDPVWFALSDPPLTTIRVSYSEHARRAAEMLTDLLGDDPDARPAPGPHLVVPELRVAGSTGPPRHG